MEQDLILFSHQSAYNIGVCDFLHHNRIEAKIVNSIYDFKAELSLHSPAFLLVDIGIEGNKALFSEHPISITQPLPYIIVADAFPNGTARAAMLRRGADACVESPINAEEVLAVINAVLRRERKIARSQLDRTQPRIEHKELVIDPMCRMVEMRKEPIRLTAKEFDVLLLLASKAGSVLTKEEIYKAVWNADSKYMGTQVSDHIFNLRRKLGLDKKDQNYIQTVFGVGYRFALIE